MSPPNNNKESGQGDDISLVAGAADFDIDGNRSDGIDRHRRPAKRIKSNANNTGDNAEPRAGDGDASSPSSAAAAAAAAAARLCLRLLFAPLPASVVTTPPSHKNDEEQHVAHFRAAWTAHGFRTSAVTSPRPAVSVYLDSCRGSGGGANDDGNEKIEAGREYLQACIGMHSRQMDLDKECYRSTLKDIYCLRLFLERMNHVRRSDMEDEGVVRIVSAWEERANRLMVGPSENSTPRANLRLLLEELAASASTVLPRLLSKLTDIDHTLRRDQLMHEYDRIAYENCTLANACLHRWLALDRAAAESDSRQRYDLDQAYFKPSPPNRYLPKYERITVHFKDPNAAEPAKGKAIWMPGLTEVLTARSETNAERGTAAAAHGAVGHPLDSVVEAMLRSTWQHLFRNGYYVDEIRKESLGPELRKFYRSGLVSGAVGGNLPILLNAHFTPTYPLSLYLHGTAGAGKSSLVRSLAPAIHYAVSRHADPELLVRFVKQNLNKPLATLQLELELRPNNNDYSVMSIIQGRRMTLSQSKPGLVLVALEEMPCDEEDADPRQGSVGRLVSMRFSGRKGDFRAEEGDDTGGRTGENGGKKGIGAPRNSTKRGISGDATIITIFTSNYGLELPCHNALQRLDMFKNLKIVKVAPVTGQDRMAFALAYLELRMKESLTSNGYTRKKSVTIQRLDIPCGDGDIRPLVRYLRLLSFYIHALAVNLKGEVMGDPSSDSIDVSVSHIATTDITTITAKSCKNESSLQLKPGSFQNLYAITAPSPLDHRASRTVSELQTLHPNKLGNPSELSQIIDFYFANTLAPTVILSQNKQLIGDLIRIAGKMEGVRDISGINPLEYKMMKSLYDAVDTPNLRDDILKILHDNNDANAMISFVAVELLCHTKDAQLQIREIIEDTPSMTAFSTERSALHKDGLLFGVFVEGEITPEIRSRASLVI